MLTLLTECHLWSIDDDIQIKPTNFGVFRYSRKQQQAEVANRTQQVSKRDYTERRSGITVPKNSRKGGRLKDKIRKLEELLRQQKIVYSQWPEAPELLLLFANGIITHISVDVYTGDVRQILFEKYLVGKLATEVITDAFFTFSHIVLAYNTNQLTVVHLQKPSMRAQGPEKIANMEPRIFHAIIPGQSDRKLSRSLSVNNKEADLFVIWTKSSQDEVYPWRPTVRDQDRANIHVFKLNAMHLELMSYCWSENDPLCVNFLRSSKSQILTVEQKVSRTGEMSAEVCSYEINSGKMQRTALISIAVGAQICCFGFSPDQEKLFLGTIDHNIFIYDLVLQNKSVTSINIVPKYCSWHSDSGLVIVANECAQFQCFDLALTAIGSQLQSESLSSSNLLDLSSYFVSQPPLFKMCFSPKPHLSSFPHSYAQMDCFLLILFENGPIGCLRFFNGAGMRGDIHNSGLTADIFVDKYLSINQLEKAVNLLAALNWETYGAMCLISLHKISNYVFFHRDAKNIDLLAKALYTFTDVLSDETKDEFSDQVFDLRRRFFFFLMRKNLFAKAFAIALDTMDYDLFMDLFNVTKTQTNIIKISVAAFHQAVSILREEDGVKENLNMVGDYRVESVCSQSSYSDIPEIHTMPMKNYVPPLPSFNTEKIKINIPKLDLRTDLTVSPTDNRNGAIPPPLSLRQLKISAPPTTLIDQPALTPVTDNEFISRPHCSSQQENNIGSEQTSVVRLLNHHGPNQYEISRYNVLSPRPLAITTSAASYMHYATPAIITERNNCAAPVQSNYGSDVPFYQHPLVSGNIPPTHKPFTIIMTDRLNEANDKKPTASILSGSCTGHTAIASILNSGVQTALTTTMGGSKGTANGEKNKVKFSETVQVAVVPDIPRKEKTTVLKRNGYSRRITNPKKELADSLPLCHPNDEYLKDFNPLSLDTLRPVAKSTVKEEQTPHKSAPTPSIKVVHFGIV